jgi:pyruvate carboxylase
VSLLVRITPEAEAQIRIIDSWWRENRTALPNLFADELAAASTSSATHHIPGASTGNLPYQIRVVLCSRKHAITSTMSPAVKR